MIAAMVDLLPADGDRRELGLCQQVDSELFFPDKGGTSKPAKQVCGACEVRPQCLEFALAHDERFGIWGGLSERERRRLKRAEAAASAKPAGDVPGGDVPVVVSALTRGGDPR